MIKDGEISQHLLPTIKSLLADDAKLKTMSQKAKQLGKPEAAATIARAALQLASNR
jgi:UDP-N-acetylglucosamine:LPS N-acetylglucosamine transferase